MRKNVTFKSKGLNCAGWLYIPENLKLRDKVPAIIMAHGLSGVKEQGLAAVAEHFAAAGFVTLVFDYRWFGASEGEPRCQLLPLEQAEDYQNAITWASQQPEVDPKRIGLWGTSYSGGIAIYVTTFDKRVKAVVGQVPAVGNLDSRRAINPARWDAIGEFLQKIRVARYETGAVSYMKVVTANTNEMCYMAGKEAYDFFTATAIGAPSWQNQITLESVEKMRQFDAGVMIHWVSPAAMLLIPAEKDYFVPFEAVKAAYGRAREPKSIFPLPINHFEIYVEPWLSKAANAAVDWFKKYL